MQMIDQPFLMLRAAEKARREPQTFLGALMQALGRGRFWCALLVTGAAFAFIVWAGGVL